MDLGGSRFTWFLVSTFSERGPLSQELKDDVLQPSLGLEDGIFWGQHVHLELE